MELDRRESLSREQCNPFRKGLDAGRVIHCAERFVQPWPAADAFQPPLVPRSGFQARLRPSVRLLKLHCMHSLKNMA